MSNEAGSSPFVTGARISRRSPLGHALAAFMAILEREAGQFLRSYRRWIADLVVVVLLFIAVSSGFGDAPRALTEPYGIYIGLQDYLVPGVAGLAILIASARAALALIVGHGSESVRFLMTAPLSRWFILFSRIAATALSTTVQAAIVVAATAVLGANVDIAMWLVAVPVIFVGAFAMTAIFAVFAIYLPPARSVSALLLYAALPLFFVSTALYQAWRTANSGASWLEPLINANPFTHVVEFVRYASEGQFAVASSIVVVVAGAVAFALAVIGTDPKRRFLIWRRTGGWANQKD